MPCLEAITNLICSGNFFVPLLNPMPGGGEVLRVWGAHGGEGTMSSLSGALLPALDPLRGPGWVSGRPFLLHFSGHVSNVSATGRVGTAGSYICTEVSCFPCCSLLPLVLAF